MTRDQVEAIRSALGEADHYLLTTPDAEIDPHDVARLLRHALAIVLRLQ